MVDIESLFTKQSFKGKGWLCPFDSAELIKRRKAMTYAEGKNGILHYACCNYCGRLFVNLVSYPDLELIEFDGTTFINTIHKSRIKRNSAKIDELENNSAIKVIQRDPNSVCPGDLSELLLDQKITINKNGRLIKIDSYFCPKCGRKYLHNTSYNDLEILIIGGIGYVNLNGESPRVKKYMGSIDKAIFQAYKKSVNRVLGNAVYKKVIVENKKASPSADKFQKQTLQQPSSTDPKTEALINQYLAERDREMREKKRREILEEKKRQEEYARKQQEEFQAKEKKKQEQKQKELEENYRRLLEQANENPRHEKDRTIEIQDFVIRRDVFKCIHKEHRLKELIGIVKVIGFDDVERHVEVAAGYCYECNLFYIFNSSYKKMLRMGIPLCKIRDGKNYDTENMKAGDMNLADESILMQYGYTVNAVDDLSASRRQKILAVLIDNGFVSKSHIISLLDFFIAQRSGIERMSSAVDKWTADREFVEEYNPGTYTRISVRELRKNR